METLDSSLCICTINTLFTQSFLHSKNSLNMETQAKEKEVLHIYKNYKHIEIAN